MNCAATPGSNDAPSTGTSRGSAPCFRPDEAAADFVFATDREGRTLWFTPSVARILGWQDEELVGSPPADFVHPEDLPIVRKHEAELLSSGYLTEPVRLRLRTRSGDYRWISAAARLVRDEHGAPAGAIVTCHDVDDLIVARDVADRERTRLRAAMDAQLDPYVVFDAVRDEEGRIVDFVYADVNTAACEFNRQPREKLVGARLLTLHPAAGASGILDVYARVVETGEPLVLDAWEYPQEVLGGELRRYDVRAVRLGDGVAHTWRNVTDRMAAVDALAASERRFRTIADYTHDWEWWRAPDGHLLYVSPSCERITGYTAAEFLADAGLLDRITHPYDRERMAEHYGHWQAPPASAPYYDMEFRIIARSGEERWIGHRCRRVILDDGTDLGVRASNRDDTDRHAAVVALAESEARLRAVIEGASEGINVLDLQIGKYVLMSPAQMAMTGFTTEEMNDLSAEEVYERCHPDDRHISVAQQRLLADGGDELGSVEYRWKVKSGEYRWFRDSRSVLRDADGTPHALVGVSTDITEVKRAEESLRRSEAHFRAFFQDASVGMATTSPEEGWLEVNDALCVMLGYTREELHGMTWAEITHPEDLEADVAQFERVLRGEIDGYSLDKRFVHKDGHVVHTHLVVHAVREDGDAVSYFAAVFEDVSERVAAEERIHALNAELERRVVERTEQLRAANEELEAFAYSVSHDLRAPLRAIDGFSQIIVEDAGDRLDDVDREHFARVRAATQRMGQLIDALLVLSRLSRHEITLIRVDLSALARQTLSRLHAEEPDRRVVVKVASRCRARTDATLAEAVLQNLLGNAWKFTSSRDEAHIEFGRRSLHGERVFFVRDDGAGFDPAYIDKLFQPFQRLHAVDEYPGTGIGLATVQRIVRRLGGRCWAEGAVDGGATFYFTLGAPEGE